MSPEYTDLMARLQRLEQDNAAMKTDCAALQAESARMEAQFQQAHGRYTGIQRRLRVQAGLAFCAFLAAVFLAPANRTAIAQGYGVTLATLNTRLLAVEAKTQYMSVDATAQSTLFTGCNVFIQSGGGNTSSLATNAVGQGVGNLIVGYNSSSGNLDVRTGSHNLILGDANNYSSYGGIVAGAFNTISAPFASVTGGEGNTASGNAASVSSGEYNIASGSLSSVSGGIINTASGSFSSVSGGVTNTASSFYSSVSGGEYNTASGSFCSVTGGNSNTASGNAASISGGASNTASGTFSSVSGGAYLKAVADNEWAAGGYHSP